jgi:hypothetical protein
VAATGCSAWAARSCPLGPNTRLRAERYGHDYAAMADRLAADGNAGESREYRHLAGQRMDLAHLMWRVEEVEADVGWRPLYGELPESRLDAQHDDGDHSLGAAGAGERAPRPIAPRSRTRQPVHFWLTGVGPGREPRCQTATDPELPTAEMLDYGEQVTSRVEASKSLKLLRCLPSIDSRCVPVAYNRATLEPWQGRVGAGLERRIAPALWVYNIALLIT